jgi:GTPase SAR1 family protein
VSRHLFEKHIDTTNRPQTGSRQAKGFFPNVSFILPQILLLLLPVLLPLQLRGWTTTVCEDCVSYIRVSKRLVEITLQDTPGQEDFDRLRPIYYPDSHIILICFAIDNPDSLDNVMEKVRWFQKSMLHSF